MQYLRKNLPLIGWEIHMEVPWLANSIRYFFTIIKYKSTKDTKIKITHFDTTNWSQCWHLYIKEQAKCECCGFTTGRRYLAKLFQLLKSYVSYAKHFFMIIIFKLFQLYFPSHSHRKFFWWSKSSKYYNYKKIFPPSCTLQEMYNKGYKSCLTIKKENLLLPLKKEYIISKQIFKNGINSFFILP